MRLSPGRHFRSMPILQWIVLWGIGLVPVWILPILPSSIPVGPFNLPEFLPLWKTVGPCDLPVKYPLYWAWTIGVLVFVPNAFREDRSRAEQNVDLKLEGPQRDIQELKDELERKISELQEQKEQLAEMDRVMRIGFERANVTLPPRRMSLRALLTLDAMQPTVTLDPRAGRFVRWVKYPALRFCKSFWKWLKG